MMQVIVYDKPPKISLDEINLTPLEEGANDIMGRMEDKQSFAQDINCLRRNGIKQTELALFFGLTRRSIIYWNQGLHIPHERRHLLIVRELARCLREKEKARKEAMLKPRMVQR